MRRLIALGLFATLFVSAGADARRVRRVVVRGPRVHVTVHAGFPVHRVLPTVVVRPGPVVRVTPRVYLAPVVFTAVALATIPNTVWTGSEGLDRDDGWTDFTIDVDRRGSGLLLDVKEGPAQLSFAEVVFENGETQVVDFNDKVHTRGTYSLLDFRDGRKVDHVRVVAKAAGDETDIGVRLLG